MTTDATVDTHADLMAALAVMVDHARRWPFVGGQHTDALRDLAAAYDAHMAAGWPDSYVPDNPHVQEVRRLRDGIDRVLDEADHWGAPGYVRDLDPGLAALHDLATALRALLEPVTRTDVAAHVRQGPKEVLGDAPIPSV